MDETKTSKQERNASRKEKQAFRQALQSEYARDLMKDLEGRTEEVSWLYLYLLSSFLFYCIIALFGYLKKVREVIGTEDTDVTRYKAKLEDRARKEEELFTCAPLSSVEKKKLKHMCKSRSG